MAHVPSALSAPSTSELNLLEQQLILGQAVGDQEDALTIAISKGDYAQVLQSPAARAIFGTDLDEAQASSLPTASPLSADFSPADLRLYIQAQVQRYAQEHGAEGWQQITWVGIACLNAFLQTNWTGPEMSMDPASVLPAALAHRWAETFITTKIVELPEDVDRHEMGRRDHMGGRIYLGAKQTAERELVDRAVLRMLESEGEEAYTLTPRPMYLLFARLLLVDVAASDDHERDLAAPAACWWAARVMSTQQSLLEYPSQALFDSILAMYARTARYLPAAPVREAFLRSQAEHQQQAKPAVDMEIAMVPREKATEVTSSDQLLQDSDAAAAAAAWDAVGGGERELWARYLLEIAVVFSQHKMPLDTKRLVAQAQAASGLQWEMTGVRGRRTKHQTFDIAQLVVDARSTRNLALDAETAPENMQLNDDTLLESINFTEKAPKADALAVVDKCILLALCQNVENENAAHGLTSEQMRPFVTRVLDRASNWSVYTTGLLQRSRLEATRTRTAERSVLQLQALVDQISRPEPGSNEAGAAERLAYMGVLALPSQWELERELAGRFMTMGIMRSALDIYERLAMWDEAISAYSLLGQQEVAERLVREQLAVSPDRPKLWCVLGDLKKDPEHWLHAWEVSGQRYARAMRSLGAYHYARSNFADAVDCYRKALALNPLFEQSWYVLGCAALQISDWETAVAAFQRTVALDDESAEGWNNLASACMRLGDSHRDRAWYALREATRHNYDSWHIWSNFMAVSIASEQFASAIHAMGRIVVLRADKDAAACIDITALRAIIAALVRGGIARGLPPKEGEIKEQQHARYLEYLLQEQIEARITRSAPLWRAMADFWYWRRDYRHCLDCYIKAYRCFSQQAEVTYDQEIFKDAVEAALELVSMYENIGEYTQTVRVPTTDNSADQEAPGNEAEERKAAAVAQPVCADWKHQAKLVLRGLIGKGKQSFEGTAEYVRLVDALEELRQA
ncbi:hypothetical protein GGF37_003501 [Kickxella alabastrina]|nr:hypothetical protein GGF37_003501 [Kickxella alabastrina]